MGRIHRHGGMFVITIDGLFFDCHHERRAFSRAFFDSACLPVVVSRDFLPNNG